MLQFSAPTDNAVKAVIIEKNHARGKRIFYYCLCSFGITLIYALLSFLLKDWSGVGAFFSDWGSFFDTKILLNKNDGGRWDKSYGLGRVGFPLSGPAVTAQAVSL